MKYLLTFGLAAALSSAAFAQLPGITPISIRGGYSYLPSHDSRDFTRTSGYTVGAGIQFPLKLYGGTLSLDVDFDSHQGNGNTIQSLGIQGVMRMPFMTQLSMPLGKMGPYYGFGLGVFHDRVSGSTTGAVSTAQPTDGRIPLPRGGAVATSSFSDTATRFGGSVLLGFQFTSAASAEVFYRLSGSVDGFKSDTVGLSICYKF